MARINPWKTDHEHITGKVRGILCNYCNSVLGYVRDNPEVLERAAKYLREAEGIPQCRFAAILEMFS